MMTVIVRETPRVAAKLFGLLLGFAAAAVIATAALAAPTGLNIIPTADLLSRGEIALEYQADGVRLFDAECDHWVLLEIGFSDRFEAGVDRCWDGDTATFGNAKLLLLGERGHRPAVALGVQGWGGEGASDPYLVASRNAGRARWHLGVIRREGDTEAMFGCEVPLAARLTFAADRVSGCGSVSTIGIGAGLSRIAAVKLSCIVAGSSDGDDGWQLIVTLSFSPGPRE